MKSFIYTTSEREFKSCQVWHCVRTVRVYRLIKGKPILVGEKTSEYAGHPQLVMDVLEDFKLLPASTFVCNHETGCGRYMPHTLEGAGIARVTGV